MKKNLWKTFAMVALLSGSLLLASCGGNKTDEKTVDANLSPQEGVAVNYTKTDEVTNMVEIDVQKYGNIVVELYPDMAPKTVANFQKLVKEKFYNGKTFHRAVPGFVIQGGSPNGDGIGGPGWEIEGEFSENGFTQNTLSHERGVLSMARTTDPNSAGSQFFIVLDNSDSVSLSLNGKYAGFGRVVSGMDVVDRIAALEADETQMGMIKDKPLISEAFFVVEAQN